jgi:hypothetical protein
MKTHYTLLLFIFLSLQLSAQNGLEHIIVEKYYVSDENDTTLNDVGGILPVNSVTYRVYVDMLPGYIFQAAFGTPEHELKIATTTRFFNNQDRGSRFPTYTRTQASKNTLMLDSWLSCGAGLKDNAGVLKEKDNGMNTIVNADDILQNAHPQAGIPLTSEDGVIVSATEPVTVVGFFDTDLSVFDDANEAPVPTIVSTHDGAWSSLNGSMGPDPAENIVLIGQFTTDGVFEFELNLQIRNQTTLAVETYVARNPVGNEVKLEELIHIDSLQIESATHDLIKLNDQVSVFPNPTAGLLSIEIDDQVSMTGYQDLYQLKAMDGSRVSSGKITDHLTSLDFSNLLPGVYILSLELENKYQFAKKIVILR